MVCLTDIANEKLKGICLTFMIETEYKSKEVYGNIDGYMSNIWSENFMVYDPIFNSLSKVISILCNIIYGQIELFTISKDL